MAEVQIEQGVAALRAFEPGCRTLHTLVPVDGGTDVTVSSHPEVVVR
jgi:hypothetical protein